MCSTIWAEPQRCSQVAHLAKAGWRGLALAPCRLVGGWHRGSAGEEEALGKPCPGGRGEDKPRQAM
jgi:hypothetical protein